MVDYVKRGYVNNPNWVGTPSDRHSPCGYWYKNVNVYSTEDIQRYINTYFYGCGQNNSGSLGQGSYLRNFPLTELLGSRIIDVSGGSYHILYITPEGTLHGAGENSHGELGVNSTSDRYYFVQVGSDLDWVQVACGDYHSLAIKSNGTLWGTGLNSFGQLGLNDFTNRKVFTQIGTDTWSYVFAGAESSYAIKSDGTLWVTGRNTYGELGLGDKVHRKVFTQVGTNTYLWAAGGYLSTLVIRSDGTLWGMGNNRDGQLGLGSSNEEVYPTQVGADNTWVKVDMGRNNHSIGLKSDGTIHGTGINSNGQLGLGDLVKRTTFTAIGSDTWNDICCGGNHTLLIKDDNHLYGMGRNNTYELNGPVTGGSQILVPTLIKGIAEPLEWLLLGAGYATSYVLSGSVITETDTVGLSGTDAPDDSVWPFDAQPDKPISNEGDELATYANPVWENEAGDSISDAITSTHIPCGYWYKSE